MKTTGENTFYLVDAGFNNLARPILYGAYHPMAICPGLAPFRRRRSAAESLGRKVPDPLPLRDVVVGGPLCESGDIFTQDEGGFVAHRALPEANVGDFLVIGYAGAYGYVMANNYNSKPLVAEVLIENGKTHLVRRRQTLDDLIREEKIPKMKFRQLAPLIIRHQRLARAVDHLLPVIRVDRFPEFDFMRPAGDRDQVARHTQPFIRA